MLTKYQIILLGAENLFIKEILKVFYRHTNELGLKDESIIVIQASNFYENYKANAPGFCLYFGNENGVNTNVDLLKSLLENGILILPIVSDLHEFSNRIPSILHNINGFQLSSEDDIEKLVSLLLEGFGLLRLSRRLFISYKRNESSTVAIQLFEQFEKNGFDVFLDTHSIRPCEPFQEELWHRLADTDIVVLLNTPGFLESNWTTQELAQANTMSIGILQLIWPNHKLERDAELSIPFHLSNKDFGNLQFTNSKSYLADSSIEKIVSEAESLRARSLAARQNNIITEFLVSAKQAGKKIDLHPEKFMTTLNANGKELVVIPTVGVPQAFTYNQSEELVNRIKSKNVSGALLLFDHRNIRDKWLKHLAWLDSYLPVKTIKIVEADKWLMNI